MRYDHKGRGTHESSGLQHFLCIVIIGILLVSSVSANILHIFFFVSSVSNGYIDTSVLVTSGELHYFQFRFLFINFQY